MLANAALNPLRVAKQRISSYASTLSGYSDYDLEQQPSEKRLRRDSLSSSSEVSEDDDDDETSPRSSSEISSRSTSQSFEPMLTRSPARRKGLKRQKSDTYARSYPKIPTRLTCGTLPPRWSGRLFSLGLLAVLVLFITTLTRSHWRSIQSVASLENKPAPPPPVWEAFPFLKRYHGGVRTLVKKAENLAEYPGEAYEEALKREEEQSKDKKVEKREIPMQSETYDPYAERRGEIVPCHLGPEGKTVIPKLQVYPGVPSGLPEAVYGSYNLLGLRDDICYERYGRYAPYGYGYSKKNGGSGTGMDGDREGIDAIWADGDYVSYNDVDWAHAANRCESLNAHRFEPKPHVTHDALYMPVGRPTIDQRKHAGQDSQEEGRNSTLPRTAVIIRTWLGYYYDAEDILYLRSLIAELALASGGEYSIHFLIHVKDNNLQIWGDAALYARVLDDALPAEFRGMGTLWSERQMGLVYGGLHESNYRDLKVHGVYRSSFQPVTWFAQQHPEYEYYWQLEVDQRYTGHWYHLFERSVKWANSQPRKGLWERNARFYVPSEHGSWEDFSHMVRVQTEHGTASKANLYAGLKNNPNVPEEIKNELEPSKPEKPIWGPEPPLDDRLDTTYDKDVVPPTSEKEDKHVWGVGEEADLILFSPIFDPDGTNWLLANDVTGYNTTRGLPPRRTAINTFGRYSRRLLDTMHKDTLGGRKSMFTEMWPPTTCLHHGFKAVYAPHPVFIDRRWPTSYLASILNNGRNGAAGGSRTSVFSDERQHNFRGTTWYYDAGFAPNLWQRWMGIKVDDFGGEQFELTGEGRMCLPGVMIHPVKQVDLREEKDVGDG